MNATDENHAYRAATNVGLREAVDSTIIGTKIPGEVQNEEQREYFIRLVL